MKQIHAWPIHKKMAHVRSISEESRLLVLSVKELTLRKECNALPVVALPIVDDVLES